MPRDGSGVEAKLAGSIAVSGTPIASAPYNLQIDDLVAASNDTVLLNGLKPIIDSKKFSFAEFPEALRYMESGAHFGKIVLSA